MKRFVLALAAVAALAFSAPAFAGKDHDPVAKAAANLQKSIDKTNDQIAKDQAKLAKLAAQDQTQQKVIDKTNALNDDLGFLGGIAAAFQAALDALTP